MPSSKSLLRNCDVLSILKKEITLAAASTSAVTCGTPAAADKGPPGRQLNFDRRTMLAFSPRHVILFVINLEMRERDNARRKFAVDIVCMEMPCQCHFSLQTEKENYLPGWEINFENQLSARQQILVVLLKGN